MKIKKILTVEDMRNCMSDLRSGFRVSKVQNSVFFQIGQLISKRDVEDKINAGWTVNVIPRKENQDCQTM